MTLAGADSAEPLASEPMAEVADNRKAQVFKLVLVLGVLAAVVTFLVLGSVNAGAAGGCGGG